MQEPEPEVILNKIKEPQNTDLKFELFIAQCVSAGCDEQLLQEEKDRKKRGGEASYILLLPPTFEEKKSTGSKVLVMIPFLGMYSSQLLSSLVMDTS